MFKKRTIKVIRLIISCLVLLLGYYNIAFSQNAKPPTMTTFPSTNWSAYKELLFVDQSLDYFTENNNFPDIRLSEAYRSIKNQKNDDAKKKLQAVADDTSVELRVRMWAWQALRELEIKPPASIGNQVRGVVLEVPTNGWVDTLAAYADGRARYVNGNEKGGGIIWEAADEEPMKTLILKLIKNAAPFSGKSMTYLKHKAVNENVLRASILTFNGIYIVEGNINEVSANKKHPMSPLFDSATSLFLALLAEKEKQSK